LGVHVEMDEIRNVGGCHGIICFLGGLAFRVAGYELRVTGYGLRVPGKKGIAHIEECGSRNAEVGIRQSPWR
jgi:hypothetical protein